MGIYQKIKDTTYEHLVKPIADSHAPPNELALGIGVGFFWGLTPLVGIQMYTVFLTWLLFKYLLRIEFDLLVGVALVWITNPLTMFFFYYAFYYAGVLLYYLVGAELDIVSYESFKGTLELIISKEDLGFWHIVWESSVYMFYDMGIPMLIGCLLFAVPTSILSYFISKPIIIKRRKAKAAKAGLAYDQWRSQFEKRVKFNLFKKSEQSPHDENKES